MQNPTTDFDFWLVLIKKIHSNKTCEEVNINLCLVSELITRFHINNLGLYLQKTRKTKLIKMIKMYNSCSYATTFSFGVTIVTVT